MGDVINDVAVTVYQGTRDLVQRGRILFELRREDFENLLSNPKIQRDLQARQEQESERRQRRLEFERRLVESGKQEDDAPGAAEQHKKNK